MINRILAEQIMKMELVHGHDDYYGGEKVRYLSDSWNPQDDESQAWMCLDKILSEPWEVYLDHQFDGWDIMLARPDKQSIVVHGNTRAHAICGALLQTLSSIKQKDEYVPESWDTVAERVLEELCGKLAGA